jgi:hypothetical protein
VEIGFGGQVWVGLGSWCSGDISGSHGVGLWKFICMGWQIFKSHFRFDSGEGSKIRFWDDVWCGDIPLKVVFSLSCLILPVLRKRPLQIMWSDLMALPNGIFSLHG